MKKYCDVDLIKVMKMITKLHTECYGDDIKLDEKVMKKQMKELKAGEKFRFVWISRVCGTNLMPLRDIFLKKSRANRTFQYYCGDAESDKTIFYLVEMVERKGRTIYGNIYELDEIYKEVSQKALPIGNINLIYEKGTRIILGGDKIPRWDENYGNLVDFQENPDSEWELDVVMGAFLSKVCGSQKSEPEELYKKLKNQKKVE